MFLHVLNGFSFDFVKTHQTIFMRLSNLRVSFKLPKYLSYEVRCRVLNYSPDYHLALSTDSRARAAQDLGESSDISGVVNMFDLLWMRVGAVFNFNYHSPLSNAQKQNLIVFMRDDNPTNARMRFVIGGLRGLISVDGITDLEPSLKIVKNIILAHISQLTSRNAI